jgi:hypothetical protein|tara:strand:- start:435 stop:668 length:234 start_codon:yes stop_codon:yes gene_type:complete
MKEVKVKYNKTLIDGMLYKGTLVLPANVKVGETVTIDGKETKVLSTSVDYRDNIQTIEVANATLDKGEKSDGKSTEG